MSNDVLVDRRSPVVILTLNRPARRNALSPQLVEEFLAALSTAESDASIDALIITGAGSSFCAGADLEHLESFAATDASPMAFLTSISTLVRRLELSRLPVVAAINGPAVAGGLEIALGCDVVVAAASALIGDGHVKNDLLPAAGSSVRLPGKVGHSMARWMALTGELVGADELARTGWIKDVVAPEDLQSTALEIAHTLAIRGGATQQRFKRLLVELEDLGRTDGLEHELDAFDAHWRSHDIATALRDFLNTATRQTDTDQGEAK